MFDKFVDWMERLANPTPKLLFQMALGIVGIVLLGLGLYVHWAFNLF